MQMMSRDKLLKLMKKPDGLLDEAERSNAISYREFLKVSHDALKKARREYDGDAEWFACEELKKSWIKDHCPPIEYLGEGSTRLAMAIDGGKCLKIASNEEGIEQNENEIQAFQLGAEFSCFPKLYAYDKSSMYSLVVDCCCEAKPEDFRRLYGTSCTLAVGTVQQLVDDGLEASKTRDYFAKCIEYPSFGENDEYECFEERLAFLSKLIEKRDSEMPWTVMWDLAKFCVENSDMISLYDLESEVNWGMTPRHGGLCPVVIDAGL